MLINKENKQEMNKLNQKAFAPVELLVVVLVLIVVAFVGFTAYKNSNNTNPDSQAESGAVSRNRGLKLVAKGGGIQTFACKIDKRIVDADQNEYVSRVKVNARKVAVRNVKDQRTIIDGASNSLQGAKYGYPISYSTSTVPVKKWGTQYTLRDNDYTNNRNPEIKFYIEYAKRTRTSRGYKYLIYTDSTRVVKLNSLNPC